MASTRCLAAHGRAVADVLSSTAKECGPDVVVMGGYSRSRISEVISGGCTNTFLGAADSPVLLVH